VQDVIPANDQRKVIVSNLRSLFLSVAVLCFLPIATLLWELHLSQGIPERINLTPDTIRISAFNKWIQENICSLSDTPPDGCVVPPDWPVESLFEPERSVLSLSLYNNTMIFIEKGGRSKTNRAYILRIKYNGKVERGNWYRLGDQS